MTKREQFLWVVQTVALANGINRSLDEDAREKRSEFSATGVFILMDEALRASELIPAEMSPAAAAGDFCTWMIKSLREESDLTTVPDWFARD